MYFDLKRVFVSLNISMAILYVRKNGNFVFYKGFSLIKS